MAVRALYESFAGNRGLFGREPNIADGMSPAQIAAYLRSDRATPNLEFQLAMQQRPRLHESASPPLTAGAAADASQVAEDETERDVDIEQAILNVMAGGGTDEEKARKIAALFNGDEDVAVEKFVECAPRMHESAAGKPGRAIATRIGRYLHGEQREQGARMAAIGCPMG